MGMRLTDNNAKAAVEIIKVLEENKCTVADISGIFSYVETKIRNATKVPRLNYDNLLREITADLDN